MLGRESVQFVAVDLPKPISTNNLWKPVKRGKHAYMIASKEYLDWQALAGLTLNTQRPGLVEGPYALTITVSSKWRGDLDNCIKAASDVLQSQGVIENDKHAQEITIRRGDCEGMKVLVVSTRSKEAD